MSSESHFNKQQDFYNDFDNVRDIISDCTSYNLENDAVIFDAKEIIYCFNSGVDPIDAMRYLLPYILSANKIEEDSYVVDLSLDPVDQFDPDNMVCSISYVPVKKLSVIAAMSGVTVSSLRGGSDMDLEYPDGKFKGVEESLANKANIPY